MRSNAASCRRFAFLFLSALCAVGPARGQGSAAPPLDFAGSHQVMLPGSTVAAGTLVATWTDDEGEGEGPPISVGGTAFGPGTAVPVAGGWAVDFASGEDAFVSINAAQHRLDIDLVQIGVQAFLIPGSMTFTPVSPNGPDGQAAMVGIAPLAQGPGGPGGTEIAITWPWWLDTWIHDVDFFQFVTVTAEVVRSNGAGGTTTEPFPQGTKIPITGNGGGTATPQQKAAGVGQVVVDGSRTYVDSLTLGVPDYRDAGGSGMGGMGDRYESLTDQPGPPPGGCGGMTGGLPNQATIVGVNLTMDFCVYVFIDGQLVFRFVWRWTCFMPKNGVPTFGGIDPVGGPCSAMDANHLAAFIDFAGGGFAGAPN
jgi:hypothetical protein